MTTLRTACKPALMNWPAAIQAAGARRASSAEVPAIESLSALFTDDASTALLRLQRARDAEPFQPLHRLRIALTLARFGEVEDANAVLDELTEKLPPTPVIDYLRALFALRGGAMDKARSLSGGLETKHPKLAQGRFLRAEVQITAAKASTVEKYLTNLPTGPEWEAAWSDLLVKLVLLHPQEGLTLAQKYLAKTLPKETLGRALVERALGWVGSSLEELAGMLAATGADTRTEELLLSILLEKLSTQEDLGSMLQTLRQFGYENATRAGMRRIYDAVLTRQAADLAAKGKYEEALRLVEESLRHQPYDPIHLQNRAALFTLMRESGPYAEAWAEMNEHQYRLLLLGAYDTNTLMQIVKTHRLFASQARGGIFRTMEGENGERPRLATNTDEIAADPELLRQWMHHTRAALVLQHLALAPNAREVFLNPEDRDLAFLRADALTSAGKSLGVLVADEGTLLGARLEALWRGLAQQIPAHYDEHEFVPPAEEPKKSGDDAEEATPRTDEFNNAAVTELYVVHLNTLAELLLICLQWDPQASQLETVEELLAWTSSECAFLNDGLLRSTVLSRGYETPYPLVVLSNRLSEARAKAGGRLTASQQRAEVETAMAELLRTFSFSISSAFKGSAKNAVLEAMPYMDRARRLDPTAANIELAAAQLLQWGEFFDEARLALERFQRLAESPSERQREQADKIAEILRQRRKEGNAGERRARTALSEDDARGYETRAERTRRIAELEQELERSPNAWSLYSELVREFAAAGRFDDAVQCADRAVAQCLSRADQMNARSLAIEARGFHLLAADDVQAARLAAVGVHEPARRALDAKALRMPLTYPELYLQGRCRLSAGVPAEAQASFQKASELCNRPLHRTVLRSLALDIDSAYRAFARSAVNQALNDGLVAEALDQAARVFGQLQNPDAWLLDFARVIYTVALDRANAETASHLPEINLKAPWRNRFDQALALPSDGERALALAQLAAELHPPSAKAAQLLADRARALILRLQAGAILARAGALLREKNFNAALAALDAADAAISTEPRIQRMRALSLLGLQHFKEADEVVAHLSQVVGSAGGAEIEQFVKGFPDLAFRQRLAAALDHLRAGRIAAAVEILDSSIPVTEQQAGEFAYCQAFRSTLQGYEIKRKGPMAEARGHFLKAMRLLEPLLVAGAAGAGTHVTELYDRLEKEIEADGRR